MDELRQIRISAVELTQFTADLFAAAGVSLSDATMVAASLVDSNLCGHESHGVVRVMEYIDLLEQGGLHSGVPLELLCETPALLACDGHFGFGQVQMRRLVDWLVPRARAMGVACGTIRNCGHTGRLGEWVEAVARMGCAAWMSVNDNGVLKCVAPPGGIEPVISTNPIAIAVPTGGDPLVLDMSTSVVANGKVRVAQVAGEQCPEGWLLDSQGQPTRDPATRFADQPGTILPLGGHKGFGLGMLLDILVGGMSGGHCPPAPEGAVECNNVLMVVFNPDVAGGADWLTAQAERLTQFARDSRRRGDVQAIRLPGDRGAALRAERLQSGIPLDAGIWSQLTGTAEKLCISVPAPAA